MSSCGGRSRVDRIASAEESSRVDRIVAAEEAAATGAAVTEAAATEAAATGASATRAGAIGNGYGMQFGGRYISHSAGSVITQSTVYVSNM